MEEEKIVLLMPVIKASEDLDDGYYPSAGAATVDEMLPLSSDAIFNFCEQFTHLELDSLEINIKGMIKSGGMTQLVVGFQGEAGMTIKLKKKENEL